MSKISLFCLACVALCLSSLSDSHGASATTNLDAYVDVASIVDTTVEGFKYMDRTRYERFKEAEHTEVELAQNANSALEEWDLRQGTRSGFVETVKAIQRSIGHSAIGLKKAVTGLLWLGTAQETDIGWRIEDLSNFRRCFAEKVHPKHLGRLHAACTQLYYDLTGSLVAMFEYSSNIVLTAEELYRQAYSNITTSVQELQSVNLRASLWLEQHEKENFEHYTEDSSDISDACKNIHDVWLFGSLFCPTSKRELKSQLARLKTNLIRAHKTVDSVNRMCLTLEKALAATIRHLEAEQTAVRNWGMEILRIKTVFPKLWHPVDQDAVQLMSRYDNDLERLESVLSLLQERADEYESSTSPRKSLPSLKEAVNAGYDSAHERAVSEDVEKLVSSRVY